MEHDAQPDRKLTDEDVKAICDVLEKRFAARFFSNVGKGVWGIAWRGFLLAMFGFFIYGVTHSR